ncbi:30S ribosomal protein S14 [Acetobacteraceae bacterium]|nr:30S ribosomal protein S14 [Acetobacteraceae bacterium]
MAKVSAVNRNNRRAAMSQRDREKRDALKKTIYDRDLPIEERFAATIKLASLPRNGSATRVRLRCEISGRSRANYRKFRMSRIALRDLASAGQIPGLTKSSW